MGSLGNLGSTVAPPASKKAPPQSAYTKDVIARGSQAVRDRQAAASLGRAQGPQSLDVLRQTGYGSREPSNSAYNQWFASQGFNPDYKVTFGQSDKGNYSGFRTEGELKAAIQGRAQQMRDEARSGASQQAGQASQMLDQLASEYDTNYADANKQAGQNLSDYFHSFSDLAGAGAYSKQGGFMPIEGTINPGGEYHDQELDPVLAGQERLQREAAGRDSQAHQQEYIDSFLAKQKATGENMRANTGYADDLQNWLSAQSEQPLQQMETSQMIDDTPLSAYATKSGGEYGVDPNLIAGWYNDASDVSDFNTQRNADSIDQYGMPYSDVQSWIASQGRQDTADQAAADKAQTTADDDQISQDVYDATGMDAKQLATSADMTPEQVWQVTQDPTYQQASQDLYQILADPEYDPEGQGADDVNGVLDQLRADPVLYRLIQAQYGAYLS